jgi:methylase of polypeptide subunit release factors
VSSDESIYHKLHQRYRTSYTAHEPRAVEVNGHPFVLHPRVFDPAVGNSTKTMLAGMTIPAGGTVLDMGCGAGVVGILAVLGGARNAVLVDRNPAAVANTMENVARHGLQQQCEALESDLFAALAGRRFDVIYFNAPFLHVDGEAAHAVASLATPATPPIYSYVDVGYQMLTRFFGDAPAHLEEHGCIQCTFASYGNQVLLDRILAQNRLVKRELYTTPTSDTGERRLVYEIRPTAT